VHRERSLRHVHRAGKMALLLCCALAFARPTLGREAADPAACCIDSWSQAEGLAQNFIRAVHQSRDGYLWVGTKGGLSRFDGHAFTPFSDPAALKGEIWAFLEDEDGTLWVGAYGAGLCKLSAGQFECLAPKGGLGGGLLTALERTGDGALWIAADGGGLTRLKDGQLTHFGTEEGLLDRHLRALRRDHEGRLWIGTMHGLNLLDHGRIVSWADRLPGVLNQHVAGIDVERDGTVWLAMFGGGVVRWRRDQWTHFTTRDGLPDLTVLTVYVDERDQVWVGSNSGLSHFEGGRFRVFRPRTARDRLDYVQRMANDREGGLWLGTATSGLLRLRDCQFRSLTSEDGLANDETHTLLEDSHGALWVGSLDGLTRAKDGVLTTFGKAQGLSSSSIRSLAEDAQGRIWIGTQSGLNVLDGGRISVVTAGGLDRVDARTLCFEEGGALWIGTDGRGILRLENGKVVTYGHREGLKGSESRAMVVDRSGRVWTGQRDGGLVLIERGALRVYTTADGLAGDSVMALSEGSDGSLWVATRSGLSRLKDGRFTTLTASQGLPADFVYQLLEDGLGNVWMVSGIGISRLPYEDLVRVAEGRLARLSLTTYGERDGMATGTSPIGWQNAAIRSRDGRLWFGTFRGIAVTDPSSLVVNTVVPPVYVEAATIDGRSVDVHSVPVAAPGAGTVEIHYTGVSFVKPEDMRYRYILQGLDKQWTEAGERRLAHYANLPPREYRFRVQACNADGVCNEEGASLRFVLRPHFHQTVWFYVALVVAIGAAGFLAYSLRVRQLHARQRELTQRVDEAMASVKTLSGLLPICAMCKKIRTAEGSYVPIESYIREHSAAEFTHGYCPDCVEKIRAGFPPKAGTS
jgi:ligand-binding sensor domain-containing protein